MRAVAVSTFSATPQLVEVPRPEPGPGELLVKLSAASVNAFDWKVADGIMDGSMRHVFPLILGIDGAGTVTAVGAGVDRLAVGDEVYGQFFHAPVGTGTYAEYVAAPQRLAISRAPRSVPASTAAAAPTAGMTALTLVDEVAADAGKTVLVVGATGGVGSFVTQLAAARGTRVIATAGSDRAEWMREFGAADTIDYRQAPVAEQVRAAYSDGIDGLIDTVSEAPAFAQVASLVRPGGTAATTVFAADPEALAERDVRGLNLNARMTVALLDRLTAEIDGGRLRIPVETTVPLADAPDALARCRSGHTRGKTVILI